MIGRRRLTWLVFALCALLVVDVLGWATWRVLKLERAERAASAEADAAQRQRLALWQMDSLVSALIARESARPYFVWRPTYAADLPYDRAWDLDDAGVIAPSPLAAGTGDAIIRLHYLVEPDGDVVSPQATAIRTAGRPPFSQKEQAPVPPDLETLRAQRLVRELESSLSLPEARARVQRALDRAASEVDAQPGAAPPEPAGESPPEPKAEPPEELRDAQLRQQLFDLARGGRVRQAAAPTERVIVGVFQPRWMFEPGREPQLVFERPVTVGSETLTQGIWIDWPALRAELLAIAVRLFPDASLEPTSSADGPTLATIPLRLAAEPAPIPSPAWTPTRLTLVVTWLASLTALAAIGLVLRAAIRLADRRGRFVTAVTHELRSPLTSFRLYTDLLRAGGEEPDKRARYIDALHRESQRLATVVENVLAYAGLRRGHNDAPAVPLADVLADLIPSLRERVAQSGRVLEERIDPRAAEAPVRVAPGSVERILANLVDNACRYGANADEPAIRLTADRGPSAVRIRVADRGPGIPPRERDRIFADFYRGRSGRGEDRGMGLGLALARGLARAERGDLRLVRHDPPGATFELTLPIDESSEG